MFCVFKRGGGERGSPVMRRSSSLIRASADEGGPPGPFERAANTSEIEFPPSRAAMLGNGAPRGGCWLKVSIPSSGQRRCAEQLVLVGDTQDLSARMQLCARWILHTSPSLFLFEYVGLNVRSEYSVPSLPIWCTSNHGSEATAEWWTVGFSPLCQ